MAQLSDLSRQRLDYRPGAGGSVVAILTVTLDDGSIHRFAAETTRAEVEALGAAFARSEDAAAVEGIFGDIWRGAKSVGKTIGNVAREVAGSKVFAIAAKGLALAAPALGPAAPAAIATAGAMGVASKLAAASLAATAGAKKAAKLLAAAAKADVGRLTKGNAAAAGELLALANRKRHALSKLALVSVSRKPASAPASKPSSAPAPARAGTGTSTGPLGAAKAGRLRSNQPGPVSAAELARAAATGRVFWIRAAA
jgi:hypothetical protein